MAKNHLWLGQILKEVGRPPLLFFLLLKFPHFPIFLGWASLSQLIFVSELVKSDLRCSNMIGIYMIPLCPFVNSILHGLPVLDTRMVFEAAGDYTWKKCFRPWNIFYPDPCSTVDPRCCLPLYRNSWALPNFKNAIRDQEYTLIWEAIFVYSSLSKNYEYHI